MKSEKRTICPHCQAKAFPAGSVEWWASEFCRALNIPFDEQLRALLGADQLDLFGEMDEGTRKRIYLAHMSRWCAARYAERDIDKAHQEYGVEFAITNPEVQKLLAAGYKLERKDLPNGDIELRLYR